MSVNKIVVQCLTNIDFSMYHFIHILYVCNVEWHMNYKRMRTDTYVVSSIQIFSVHSTVHFIYDIQTSIGIYGVYKGLQ